VNDPAIREQVGNSDTPARRSGQGQRSVFSSLQYARVLLLLTTAAPGGIRLLQLSLFAAFYGLTASGIAASAMNVAQLLGTVTAVGFCALLLVRLPSSTQGSARRHMVGRLLLASLLTTMAVLVIGSIVALVMRRVEWFGCVSLLVVGWTVQQLARHSLIGLKRYLLVLVHDLIFLGASVVMLWIGRSGSFDLLPFSIAFATCCMTSAAVPFFAYSPKGLFSACVPTRADVGPGLGMGMNNLMSAAPALLLVPTVSLFVGHSTAGLIAFASSVLNVLGLIPRAMSLNSLAKMTDRGHIALAAATLKRLIHRYLAITVPCFMVALVYGAHAGGARVSTLEWSASLLLLFAFSLQQLVLPVSNVLMKHEKTLGPVLAGAVSLAGFLGTCGLAYAFGAEADLRLAPFLGVAVAGLIRFVVLMYLARVVERSDA